MTRLPPLVELKLADPVAEQARASHADSLRALRRGLFAEASVLAGIELADATETPIAHKLGRVPKVVIVSPHRGASAGGAVEEIRTSTYDRARVVVLKATGFSATVTVDVVVA